MSTVSATDVVAEELQQRHLQIERRLANVRYLVFRIVVHFMRIVLDLKSYMETLARFYSWFMVLS